MSSKWEIASDIFGFSSALLLLIPAFGSNTISKRITQVKDRLSKLRAKHGAGATVASGQAVTSTPLTADQKRLSDTIEFAEQFKERWTARDELYLKIAAALLVISFALKLGHYLAA